MAFNKVSTYGDSLGILDSEVGLVCKTAQATQALASTVDGRKLIKAGTLYDDTADTYEAATGLVEDSYEEVTPESGDNPKTKGWYTKSGSTYSATNDTSVQDNTTYYELVPGDSPKALGLYTKSGSTYSLTNDTSVQDGTTYYAKVREATGMVGVVLQDYDVTDYAEGYPISVVVAGRLREDRVSSEAVSAKSTLAGQGLYLV